MTISNEEQIVRYQKERIIRSIVFIPLIIGMALLLSFESQTFGIPDQIYIMGIILLSIFYLFVIYYYYTLDPNYFYYNDDENAMVFKYYSTRLISSAHNRIEIPFSVFVKFQLKTKFFGKKTELILFQKTPKGIAKYPPISLSGLSGSQINQLKNNMESHQTNR